MLLYQKPFLKPLYLKKFLGKINHFLWCHGILEDFRDYMNSNKTSIKTLLVMLNRIPMNLFVKKLKTNAGHNDLNKCYKC